MITFDSVSNIPEYKRQNMKVEEIMTSVENLIVMHHNQRADEALKKITQLQMGRIFVCDEQGRLGGLVSKTGIIAAARKRQINIKESSSRLGM